MSELNGVAAVDGDHGILEVAVLGAMTRRVEGDSESG